MLAVGGYILLVLGPSVIFGVVVGPDNPIIIGLGSILAALLLNPVRAYLQKIIDTLFFRGERAHQDRLKIFTRELTNAVALTEILRILREQISVSLLPNQLHIYIYRSAQRPVYCHRR